VTSTVQPAYAGQVPAQVAAHRDAGAGVQRGERLVQQQQARGGRKGAGQRHPLGLPPGQPPGTGVGLRGQPHPVQPGQRLLAGRPLAQAAGPQAEGDVVGGAQVREEQVVLEDHADRPVGDGDEDAVGGGVQAPAGQLDPPAVQGDQPGERPQHRRLAGAVGSEQGEHAAGCDGQLGVHREGAPLDLQRRGQPAGPGAQVAPPVSQRSRRLTSTATDTTSRTSESTTAVGGSLSRAR
jgi:hypothetical protein